MPENDEATLIKLHPSRFGLAESKRNIHYIVPVGGTPLSAVLNPGYWTHIAGKLRPTDRIEVHAEDGSYFAELLVRDCGRVYAKVEVIHSVTFEDKSVTADIGHEVTWKGPHHRWAVTRMSDKATLQAGFASKEDAGAWLITNAKSLAA